MADLTSSGTPSPIGNPSAGVGWTTRSTSPSGPNVSAAASRRLAATSPIASVTAIPNTTVVRVAHRRRGDRLMLSVASLPGRPNRPATAAVRLATGRMAAYKIATPPTKNNTAEAIAPLPSLTWASATAPAIATTPAMPMMMERPVCWIASSSGESALIASTGETLVARSAGMMLAPTATTTEPTIATGIAQTGR